MLHIARTSASGCHAAPVQYRMFHVSLSFATSLKTNAGQDKRSQHQGVRQASLHVGLARHALAEKSCCERGSLRA